MADLRDWLTRSDSVAKLRGINGVGPKTIDYFKILAGLPAVEVDRRLAKFLNMAGIDYGNYDDAQDVIDRASDLLGYDRAHLDQSIWQYIGGHS